MNYLMFIYDFVDEFVDSLHLCLSIPARRAETPLQNSWKPMIPRLSGSNCRKVLSTSCERKKILYFYSNSSNNSKVFKLSSFYNPLDLWYIQLQNLKFACLILFRRVNTFLILIQCIFNPAFAVHFISWPIHYLVAVTFSQ